MKFCWNAMGQGLVESHPDSLEFLLLNSSLCTAQRFCDAIKRDICCPSSCKEMPLGCPPALLGTAAPSSAAAVTSACPKRLCRHSTKPADLSVHHRDMVPILQGMQSSAEHSTREGVQLPLLLHQPSQRAPPPVRNTPRYPTGRRGDDLCLWEPLSLSLLGSGSAAPAQPTQPALASPRSPGSLTSWSREESAAV